MNEETSVSSNGLYMFIVLYTEGKKFSKKVLEIRRIFSLVDMITKPKISNCPNVFKIGLFR